VKPFQLAQLEDVLEKYSGNQRRELAPLSFRRSV
jgi:hypothetical protein